MKNKDIQRIISDCDRNLMELRRIVNSPDYESGFKDPKKAVRLLVTYKLNQIPEVIRLMKTEKQILQRALSGSRESHQVWKVMFWQLGDISDTELFIGSSFENAKKYILKVWRILKGKLNEDRVWDYEVEIIQEKDKYAIQVNYKVKILDPDGIFRDHIEGRSLRVWTSNYTNAMNDMEQINVRCWDL